MLLQDRSDALLSATLGRTLGGASLRLVVYGLILAAIAAAFIAGFA